MKICLPTEDAAGMDSRLCGHFGRAPYLTVVDTETGEAQPIEGGGRHEHGSCASARAAALAHIDAVVCLGMGRRALEALGDIPVYITEQTTVREVLADLQAGRLRRLEQHEACGGHGDCDR